MATQRPPGASPDSTIALPLVIVAKVDNTLRLSAVDRAATSLGLAVGTPLADAHAMVPAFKVIAANESADKKLLGRIADWCERFTPFIALDPPHMLLLDITGTAHLFGGEMTMLDQIRSRLEKQGFAVRGAIAGAAVAARALARCRNGAVAPSGQETTWILPLPVEALNLDPITTHAFRRAGLRTIGEVAARNRTELVVRFGASMMFMLDNALGRVEKPISPRVPTPEYRVEHHFAEPVVTLDALLATLKTLAERLSTTMEERGDGARRLEAVFFRADGAVRRVVIETAKPTRDSAIIERLFREKVKALADPLDPGFGYDLVRLDTLHAERATLEAAGFDDGASKERELRFLVDRLAARFGSQRLMAFQPNDTHIPEATAVAVPAQHARTVKAKWGALRDRGEPPRRPLHLFAEPEPVEVIADPPEGPPRQFRWRRALHMVIFAEGPERIAMEWWRHRKPQLTRDYFRVEDEEGRRFWLYRNGIYARETSAPRWFVHGVFA